MTTTSRPSLPWSAAAPMWIVAGTLILALLSWWIKDTWTVAQALAGAHTVWAELLAAALTWNQIEAALDRGHCFSFYVLAVGAVSLAWSHILTGRAFALVRELSWSRATRAPAAVQEWNHFGHGPALAALQTSLRARDRFNKWAIHILVFALGGTTMADLLLLAAAHPEHVFNQAALGSLLLSLVLTIGVQLPRKMPNWLLEVTGQDALLSAKLELVVRGLSGRGPVVWAGKGVLLSVTEYPALMAVMLEQRSAAACEVEESVESVAPAERLEEFG